MTTNNDDENYGPDIQEMNIRWDKIAKDHETCLIVEFHITKLGARNMIDEWDLANAGDEEAFEKELEADVLALSWDDLVDLYDEDEIEYDESPDEEGEELEEGITPAGRLKKKFNAMRTKSRRMMARNIAIKRVSSPEKLKSRSIRAARRMVYKRLLRNRDISTVSSSEKTRLEAQIKRMAPMVARLSIRVMPAVRKLEQSRIKNSRTRKKK